MKSTQIYSEALSSVFISGWIMVFVRTYGYEVGLSQTLSQPEWVRPRCFIFPEVHIGYIQVTIFSRNWLYCSSWHDVIPFLFNTPFELNPCPTFLLLRFSLYLTSRLPNRPQTARQLGEGQLQCLKLITWSTGRIFAVWTQPYFQQHSHLNSHPEFWSCVL